MPREVFVEEGQWKKQLGSWLGALAALVVLVLGTLWLAYDMFVIDVPAGYLAVLIRKEGLDVTNADEVAPDAEHKGVQKEVLKEGRYFFKYNPYAWKWEVHKQTQ